MSSDDETYKLFRIRRTVMEMLRDRGYLVLPDVDIDITMRQFVEKFGESVNRDDLEIKKAKKNDPTDQIFVFFIKEAKVGVKHIKQYLDRMKSENVRRGILIAQQNLSPTARASVLSVSMKEYKMEAFLEPELVVNITQHMLVPKHEVLTDDESKALLAHYRVKVTQLPRILVTDPIAKYYGVERRQIMKITRKSETAGEYITYRYVI